MESIPERGIKMPKKTNLNKSLCCLVLLPLFTFTLLAGCKSKESYKRDIERKGVTYSTDSFLDIAKTGNKEMIALFMKAGMDVNVKGGGGETVLMLTAVNHNIELLKFLVDNGADVNAVNNDGYTTLMFVSSQGDAELAKLLIEKGADMNVQNNNGETALMLAALNDSVETSRMLVDKGADVHIKDNKGNKAMDYAFLNDQISALLRKSTAEK
jgi:ankyrin repeat protein